MGWAKLDDRRHTNAKLRRAGLEAAGLDAYALTYCSANETDGFVDEAVVEMLAGVRNWRKIVERLVDAGRWTVDESGSGWWLVNYLEFNPSHGDLESKRTSDRVRKESARNPRGTFKESHHPDPTRPDPYKKARQRTSAPLTFSVDNQIQQWAKDHGFEGLDLKAETEKFLDWHRAKGSLFKDWNAAWRSWIRKAAEFNPNAVKSVTPAVSVNERQKREVRLRLEGNLRAARLSDDRDAIDEMEARLEALA